MLALQTPRCRDTNLHALTPCCTACNMLPSKHISAKHSLPQTREQLRALRAQKAAAAVAAPKSKPTAAPASAPPAAAAAVPRPAQPAPDKRMPPPPPRPPGVHHTLRHMISACGPVDLTKLQLMIHALADVTQVRAQWSARVLHGNDFQFCAGLLAGAGQSSRSGVACRTSA